MKDIDKGSNAKPFLKWAGGKKQLLTVLEDNLPNSIKDSKKIENYFELFVGGGALFFYLYDKYDIKNIYLNDSNKELILTYNTICNDSEELINLLSDLQDKYTDKTEEKRKDIYLNIRSEFNKNLDGFDYDNYSDKHIERASQMIFLNKTCFNGLFRLNSKGKFNVPKGRYKNPKICDVDNILNVSKVLKDVNIFNKDYSYLYDLIDEDSFVYLDPPYRPITKSSFTAYSKKNFNDENQKELAIFFKNIHNKGAKVLESNSDPKNNDENDVFFDVLYENFNIKRVKALRYINSKGTGRGNITELLISNY